MKLFNISVSEKQTKAYPLIIRDIYFTVYQEYIKTNEISLSHNSRQNG